MKTKTQKYLMLFLCLGIIEISAEFFAFIPAIILTKPLLPLLLLLAYRAEFKSSSFLFSSILITSSITNFVFIWINDYLILGVFVFSIHRILMIIFLIKMLKIKDFIPLILATIPFLLFSIFIFTDINFQNPTIQYSILFQNFMISILGGMALSQYVLNDSSRITWLMMAIFLFFCLHFLIFIELFYAKHNFMRSLAMLLNISAFFTFYKFVVILTNEDNLSKNIDDHE